MNKLVPVEYKNQRILLTSQLAESYETTSEIISQNFKRNEKRYSEGKDFYYIKGDELKEFKANLQFEDQLKFSTVLYLWTERGALRHAKSLGTDKAWEVYDMLVETYFKVQEIKPMTALDFMEYTLKAMKEQQIGILDTNKRIDNIGDIIALDTRSWREDARKLIVRIAQKMGGNDYIKDVQKEIYQLIDKRGGKSLETRLTNKRRRMADEGICKSKREKLNRVDVIAEDKVLIELYVAIVKEMAIKYGVEQGAA